MIWVKCIFGLLIFEAITCAPEVSHGKSIRTQRGIPGGLVEKDPNDPKYYDLANKALIKYARGTYQSYSVVQVTRAAEQLVSGLLTQIDFYATPTTNPCQCQNNPLYNPYSILVCHATISEQSWLYNQDISVNCDPLQYGNQPLLYGNN